jgi:hypothetical protein
LLDTSSLSPHNPTLPLLLLLHTLRFRVSYFTSPPIGTRCEDIKLSSHCSSYANTTNHTSHHRPASHNGSVLKRPA